jgi:hypothetical protein
LEGEVLEALAALGGQEAIAGLEGHTVDPHQFLGMELNPRAVAIAELVLWIGHIQWHLRTKGGTPSEPILRAFKNIVVKDAVLQRDRADGGYIDPRRPEWPEAEYVVGNPPFIGKGVQMRTALGEEYLGALRMAHPHVSESADFVMYWWDRAAEILNRPGTLLRRFGLVTTNSITQFFNRRIVARHLTAKKAVSLALAIPDHPWTKATPDAAAVRIAMTVARAGRLSGTLSEVIHEDHLDTDEPLLIFSSRVGEINSDLTVGVDVTSATALLANEGLASMGPALGGRGFVLSGAEAQHLRGAGDAHWLKRLTTGRDITGIHRRRFAIDVRDFESETSLMKALPRVYQHLKGTVYPERRNNNDPKLREFWWRFRRSKRNLLQCGQGVGPVHRDC